MNFNWTTLSSYQPLVSKMLTNSMRSDRLSHAYIFEGPKGTKKIEAAILFAKSLLCEHTDDAFNPCEHCHQCQRIDSDTHPNVFLIHRDGEKIKKKQMKDLITEFSKASIEKGPRIYIIDEADRLNIESANTLLKTMEEPGADIYQIMVTDEIGSMLPTIKSRAQIIHFQPIDKSFIKERLLHEGVSLYHAEAISEVNNNDDSALSMAKDEMMISIIDFAKEVYHTLAFNEGSIVMKLRNRKNEVLSTSDYTDLFLTMLILFQKDLLNMKLYHKELLSFSDQVEVSERLSKRMSVSWIKDTLDMMLGLKQNLKYNINSDFAFDKLFLSLERGFYYGVSSSSSTI